MSEQEFPYEPDAPEDEAVSGEARHDQQEQTEERVESVVMEAVDEAAEVEVETQAEAAEVEAETQAEAAEVEAETQDEATETESENQVEAEAETEAAEAETEAAEVAQAETEAETEAEDEESAAVSRGPGEWYVVHTYAGYENKVKANLQSRIASMQMEEKIYECVIPMEDVMEIKGGKKQVVQRKVFPGYLLVRMVYDNDSWYVVRNTPGVTGFVSSGTGSKPTPLSPREVEKILAVKKETQVKPQFRLEWEEGDVVRIITGPFADFTGTINEINLEQSKLKVLVNIFDRETPVELAFDQVAKA